MQPSNYKTKMCKTFLSGGTCSTGSQCHYAHGTRELRNMFKPVAAGVGQGQGSVSHGGGHSAWGVTANVKTVLCKNWADGSGCNYGDNCSFAHGEEQLQGSKEQKVCVLVVGSVFSWRLFRLLLATLFTRPQCANSMLRQSSVS